MIQANVTYWKSVYLSIYQAGILLKEVAETKCLHTHTHMHSSHLDPRPLEEKRSVSPSHCSRVILVLGKEITSTSVPNNKKLVYHFHFIRGSSPSLPPSLPPGLINSLLQMHRNLQRSFRLCHYSCMKFHLKGWGLGLGS